MVELDWDEWPLQMLQIWGRRAPSFMNRRSRSKVHLTKAVAMVLHGGTIQKNEEPSSTVTVPL